MRILFVNEIEGATVTAVNGSLNYPPTAIFHPFLRKRFKSTIDLDTLTIDLAAAVSMNCFFMGFHNVTAGTVTFLDGTLSPVGSPIDLASAADIFVSYFATISVKRIVVDVQATSGRVYIGGIGAGLYVQMPDHTAGAEFAVADDTAFSESMGGQTSRNAAPSLRAREWVFPDLDQVTKDALDPYVVVLGIGKPVYMDLFESNRAFDPPAYAKLMAPRKLTNPATDRYDLTLNFKEAR